jgi:predicted alpha/beta superfamily hydrolase
MHDGQNLFSTQPRLGASGWQVDVTLDAATHDASLPELIVIAPENLGGQRKYEYTPTRDASGKSGGGDLYLKMLVEELKPQVDKVLRTQPERATTGILGSSLGGLISVHAGTTHASTFGLVGALSPSTWWDDEVIVREVKAMTTPRPDKVYVDCGTDGTHDDEDGLTDTQHLFETFARIGYVEGRTFTHIVQQGGHHSEKYWAERLPGALRFLFGPRV